MEKEITYGIYDSPLWGSFVAAQSDEGLCYLGFGEDLDDVKRRYPAALFVERPQENMVASIEAAWRGTADLPLDLSSGTRFQQQVWKALRTVPFGQTRSYQEIAVQIGKPRAARAVGQAVGANPIGLLVPCHRVICRDGALGGYYWGQAVKRRLLMLESQR